MRSKYIGILFVLSYLLTGCIPEQTIEELAVISGRGIDFTEDNRLEKTLNVIRFDPQSDDLYTTLTGIGDTLKGAREEASYRTAYELVEGQLNIEIFGKEVAQQGIAPYLSSSVRDALASDTMKLLVSETTAKEIFHSDSSKSKTIGNYLDTLINKEVEEGKMVPIVVHDFTRRTETIGQDGILPIVGLRENEPRIVGIALFQGYRYVADITLHQGTLINLFRNKLANTPMQITLPREPFKKYIVEYGGRDKGNSKNDNNDEISFHLRVVKGNSKTKVKDVKNLTYHTDIHLKVDLMEATETVSIKNSHVADIFEREMEKEVKAEYEELLKQTQDAKSDPFGYGKLYRANTKDGKLTEKEWREKFPNIHVNFHVHVELMNYGTIK
ncbi:Ger(x)C family spore germination protein [Oceanobacillus senegalensis]|uniref:Ger(x)C family spore germination protein n=1 Tax=Oceanobacillus senegalensis TaxID=1936063 RepID=UPI0015C4DDB9|nr:Ger(x)C family spore germination C-terminal domain-containing protein [Oceanobacillus senegalensis]